MGTAGVMEIPSDVGAIEELPPAYKYRKRDMRSGNIYISGATCGTALLLPVQIPHSHSREVGRFKVCCRSVKAHVHMYKKSLVRLKRFSTIS
jgi:hypothetical protein